MIRYLLVSPTRNEAEYAERTLESVVSQTILPSEWVIVDDGSDDGTAELLARYAAEHDFIRVITRKDRGRRSVGPGVVEAFDVGYREALIQDPEFLCKLDMDLELPPRYFERLAERMRQNPRLGSASGKPYAEMPDGELVDEGIGDDTSAGMTKFYRKRCFDQIGGLVREVMWDGIDCHRARMHGWMAESFDEPELRFKHLRPMGSSQGSLFSGRMRHGYGQWFMGTGLVYMTASALFRATRRPLLVGGFAMWLGYLASMLRGKPRYEDREFRTFLRSYHRSVLLHGKQRTMRRLEEQFADRWTGSHAPQHTPTA